MSCGRTRPTTTRGWRRSGADVAACNQATATSRHGRRRADRRRRARRAGAGRPRRRAHDRLPMGRRRRRARARRRRVLRRDERRRSELGRLQGAAWNVYVNQSLNALAATRTFGQVQATTHPIHYDSICLNGLGCDIAVPAATARSPTSSRSATTRAADGCRSCTTATTRSRTTIAVTSRRRWSLSQIAGPSNGGTTVAVADHTVVRSSSADPAGDALSSTRGRLPALHRRRRR